MQTLWCSCCGNLLPQDIQRTLGILSELLCFAGDSGCCQVGWFFFFFFGSRKNRENGFFVVVVLPGKAAIESAIIKWSLMSKNICWNTSVCESLILCLFNKHRYNSCTRIFENICLLSHGLCFCPWWQQQKWQIPHQPAVAAAGPCFAPHPAHAVGAGTPQHTGREFHADNISTNSW